MARAGLRLSGSAMLVRPGLYCQTRLNRGLTRPHHCALAVGAIVPCRQSPMPGLLGAHTLLCGAGPAELAGGGALLGLLCWLIRLLALCLLVRPLPAGLLPCGS